jgi:beta-phosphoglucomutase
MFAVIFDMDGVIVDSNPPHKIAIRKFCQKYGFELNDEEMRLRVYGRTNRDWLSYLFGQISEEQLQQYAAEKEALYRDIYKENIKALDGIREFILMLHQQNIPKAIGTSAPASNVAFTLENTGLLPYFSIILDERDVKQGKPHPEIYLKTAAALSMPPEKCVVFEDSLSGVESAKTAGCKVVGVSTTHSAEELSETEFVIQDFQSMTIEKLQKLWFN